MIFSSPFFLFLYFPIVLILYYISPLRWRNLVLLIVNLRRISKEREDEIQNKKVKMKGKEKK